MSALIGQKKFQKLSGGCISSNGIHKVCCIEKNYFSHLILRSSNFAKSGSVSPQVWKIRTVFFWRVSKGLVFVV